MADQQMIATTNLLLDHENPRLAGIQQSQTETIHAMLRAEGPTTLALADSIAHEGVSPMERLIVMPAGEDDKRFIVLEGNRRVTAIKLLTEPALAEGAISAGKQKKLVTWSGDYHKRGIISEMECVVFPTREEANPWIERRHRGNQGGLGIVRWGATEAARFDARRSGKYSPELQVLDYVAQYATLDDETRDKLHNVSITNLERLISDKAVRDALGFEIDDEGWVQSRYPEKEALKPLIRIIGDLAHDKIVVGDIYNAKERQNYLKRFRKAELPSPSTKLPAVRSLLGKSSPSAEDTAGAAARTTTRHPKPRSTIVPTACRLDVTVPKLVDVYRELRKLKLEQYPNAVAVLLRVFVESSVDEVIERDKLMTPTQSDGSKLRDKIQKVADHLKAASKLTEPQYRAVKKAAQDQKLLVSSIKTFHEYVHNRHISPSATDLRAAWDNLQPFLEAIWP